MQGTTDDRFPTTCHSLAIQTQLTCFYWQMRHILNHELSNFPTEIPLFHTQLYLNKVFRFTLSINHILPLDSATDG